MSLGKSKKSGSDIPALVWNLAEDDEDEDEDEDDSKL